MRERLAIALEAGGGHFVELRVRREWTTTVVLRRRRTDVAFSTERLGGVARCLAPGSGWGAVAFDDLERAPLAVRRARELALELDAGTEIALAPIPLRQLDVAPRLDDDPRDVPLADKHRLADAVAAELLETDRRVADTRVTYVDRVQETWLATSEGTWLHERRAVASLGALAVALEDGASERAVESVARCGGLRTIEAAVPGLARRVASRAIDRLHALPVPAGRYPVVLDPRATGALALAAVVDRCRALARGVERALLPIGTRLGPDGLTIGDDPTAAGLPGSLVLDDEGTPVTHTPLVQNGVVVGHLHTRETAARARAAPTGHALAPTLRSVPGARAANPYVARGKADPAGLVGDVDRGLYLEDVLMLGVEGPQVTFMPGAARMIRRGELAEAVKCPALTADLLALFGRLDGVGSDFAWDASAARLSDGARPHRAVTAGAPHTRFVDVGVGAMYA